MKRWPLGLWRSLSGAGLILGTLFFAASLTPTLIPRSHLMQGVLGGVVFAIGYLLGVSWRWLWHYLELPDLPPRLMRVAKGAIALACAAVAVVFLWWTADWQNSIRALMGLEPVTTGHPFKVSAIAVATFLVLLGLARLFTLVLRIVAHQAGRVVPRRVANVVAVTAAVLLFWSLATDVFFSMALRALDSSFRQFDALIEPSSPQPTSPLRSGSPDSLLRWAELGRAGREFIASGPRAADIKALTEADAVEPIRIYVGLRAADTAQGRARLALEELKRTGAFTRGLLVVITPTGTGWVDPAAMDGLEYLHRGNVASVAMQYSYLNSPLSLLVQPEYGVEAARALFAAVYDHWRTLPRDTRPKLYLHGLSLGSLNSERSVELFEILGDPIQGALWSGPPFRNQLWRRFTDDRNAGSPAWLPQFRDGAFVRFMNQKGIAAQTGDRWGPMRVIYLQYASDAVTFFDPRDAYRPPDWMNMPRGPDVSPALRWYPVVTMLQLALDMMMATNAPIGHGHVYAPEHYVEGWIALTDPSGWSKAQIAALKAHLTRAMETAPADADEESPYANRGG